jgi:hypothetical protein
MHRRWWQGAVVCVLALVMLGADSGSRFGKLGLPSPVGVEAEVHHA